MNKNLSYPFMLILNSLILYSQCFAIQNEIVSKGKVTESSVVTYNYPRIAPVSKDFTFKANGKDVMVYQTSAGPFAAFSCDGPVLIEIEFRENISTDTHVSPLKHGIEFTRSGNSISFNIPGPILLSVMSDLLPVLYIYANPLENNPPDPYDPNVLYFRSGQVYEIGDLDMESHQTLFIEGGAIVRGSVRATSAENVRIAGYGVLDGSYYYGENSRRSILFENTKNSIVEDIIMIEPTSWMIVLGYSENITVRNVKQLGLVSTSDGVDVVGSRHIRILDSFLRNGDDCVAIKSFNLARYENRATMDYSRNVFDVEVRGCIMIANAGGHIFEIGHELTTDSIFDIRFIDNDVLGVHDLGGVFGINNSDRAVVSDILYENIRVEHYYNKLINIRIIKSRFHTDSERGQIRNITFRNIDITNSRYNPGYSVSIIGGYDENHTVENVVFENFRVNGEKIFNGDQIYLFTKQVKGIVFR